VEVAIKVVNGGVILRSKHQRPRSLAKKKI